MAGSIIVAVRKAVIADLVTLTGTGGLLAGVDVKYCWKAGDREREQLWTQRGRGDTPAASMRSGRNFRQETGRFEVVIRVESVGGTPEDADTRALALGLVVEERVADRKNNEYGVTGLQWIKADGWELNNASADSGSLSELVYDVTYHARLT